MLVSTKGRYALRVMLDLAQEEAGEYLSLTAVAEKEDISVKYLESIVSSLTHAGLIEGTRGKGGGYRLSRPAEGYSVGEILRAAEGSLAPVACLTGEGSHCGRASCCRTRPLWEKLDGMISSYLDSVSLVDLLCGE